MGGDIKYLSVGERIKKLRTELNLTAEDLGRKIGKDRATIYRYESGDISNIPINIIKPLARALETTTDYILGYSLDDRLYSKQLIAMGYPLPDDFRTDLEDYEERCRMYKMELYDCWNIARQPFTEDTPLEKREKALSHISDILSSAGYRLGCETFYDDVFYIKNINNQTLKTFSDEELISVYTKAIENDALSYKTFLSNDMEARFDSVVRENKTDYSFSHNYKPIPILGTVCAGNGIWCEENYDGHIAVDNKFRVDFALNVKGDSMTGANINDGDLALFQKTPDVDNGQIAAVLLKEDNIVVLKKVYKKEDGSLRLQPSNDNYEPIITNDFIILGRFVGIYYKEMV